MFITFEGIDGSGKSTQVLLLKERLEAMGLLVDIFREPGGTELSEQIRHLLLETEYEIDPFSELLLFSAARSQLVSKKIRPALQAGHVVICDRFFDSTAAYQGAGRGLESIDWMIAFQEKVTRGLIPDRTYFLSISVEEAIARRNIRSGEQLDRMERAGDEFYERVVYAYQELASRFPERILQLDGSSDMKTIHDRIWVDIKDRW